MAEFEHLGFFREYVTLDGKNLGTQKCEKDRDVIGYSGRITEHVQETIILDNGKKIKPGVWVKHSLYPLCGRIKKKG